MYSYGRKLIFKKKCTFTSPKKVFGTETADHYVGMLRKKSGFVMLYHRNVYEYINAKFNRNDIT